MNLGGAWSPPFENREGWGSLSNNVYRQTPSSLHLNWVHHSEADLVCENRISSKAATQLRFPWFILLLLLASPTVSAEMPPAINSSADALRAAETISDRHGTIVSADQTCLFYRFWPAEAPGNRIVLVLHGIGYHSGP